MVLERTQKIWEKFEKCGCMSKGRGIDGGTGRPVAVGLVTGCVWLLSGLCKLGLKNIFRARQRRGYIL